MTVLAWDAGPPSGAALAEGGGVAVIRVGAAVVVSVGLGVGDADGVGGTVGEAVPGAVVVGGVVVGGGGGVVGLGLGAGVCRVTTVMVPVMNEWKLQ